MTAGALGGDVSVSAQKRSLQGDSAIFRLLKSFGAETCTLPDPKGDGVLFRCRPPAQGHLHGIEIDASQIPDLVPILAVAGAFAEGETRIYNAERLRIKESDRLSAMAEGLSRLGADISELPTAF